MLSDMTANNNARTTLEAVVGNRTKYNYRNSVNRTAGGIGAQDAFQAWSQREDEVDPVEFWQQWHGTNPGFPQTSPEFKEALADAIVAAAAAQVSSDSDLRAMTDQYEIDLKAGKKVVLVAHSQGNFYANNATTFIINRFPEFAQSIGVVSVATPAGSLPANSTLTQNELDYVIFVIVASKYPVIPKNIRFTGNDEYHHGFLTTYMLPGNARNRIANQIRAMINSLAAPLNEECDDGVAKTTTLTAQNVTSTTATVRADVSQGVGVQAWFSVDKLSSNVSCNAIGPGATQITAPAIHTQDISGLTPNTLYFVKACAKGPKGSISDGGIKQFITEKNSGKIGIAVLDFVSVDSFSLKAQVLEGIGIDTWFVRGTAGSTHIPSCAVHSNNYDGIGTASAGDTVFSGTFTGLAHSSQYRVRGCAKGSDGITNAGPINVVQTTTVPVLACSPQAYRGSSEGLSVIYSLGNTDGFAKVTFETFTIPDALQIFKHNTNQLLLSTNGPWSGKFSKSFQAGGIDKVDVFVYGNSNAGTEWELSIECPQPL